MTATTATAGATSHPSIPLVELPPRPEGGYPLEFFDTWPSDPEGFVAHLDAYMRANDDHSDFFVWHVARANEQAAAAAAAAPAPPTVLVSARLPEPMVAEVDRRASKPDGRTGIIKRALEEFFANHPAAAAATGE